MNDDLTVIGRIKFRGGRRRGFVVTDAAGNIRLIPFGDAGDVLRGDGTVGPGGGGATCEVLTDGDSNIIYFDGDVVMWCE